ncbi:hypothetical protein EVAR_55413_1 [Eumeta japonica]|uniref:Uncharacterized protein n=1 Tax=Eumeta variegata TaxID=151549 RepID=A0A4C1Z6C2_EUMVA|nr:hypothetical protein EVAR_55413_1 [Eumeta japonica]
MGAQVRLHLQGGQIKRLAPLQIELLSLEGAVTLHTDLTDEGRGRTMIYSDDLDVGLGPMLDNCVDHRNLVVKVTAAPLDLEALLEYGALRILTDFFDIERP